MTPWGILNKWRQIILNGSKSSPKPYVNQNMFTAQQQTLVHLKQSHLITNIVLKLTFIWIH